MIELNICLKVSNRKDLRQQTVEQKELKKRKEEQEQRPSQDKTPARE